MYGLTRKPFYFDSGNGDGSDAIEWVTGATYQSTFQFQLSPNAGNEYQGNGINATLTATMVQYDGSF